MKKLKNTTLRNDGSLLSGLQCNALASLVHFAKNKVNQRSKCIALETREEAAIIPWSTALEFSRPCLVSVLFPGPALTSNETFSETLPPSFFSVLGEFLQESLSLATR